MTFLPRTSPLLPAVSRPKAANQFLLTFPLVTARENERYIKTLCFHRELTGNALYMSANVLSLKERNGDTIFTSPSPGDETAILTLSSEPREGLAGQR